MITVAEFFNDYIPQHNLLRILLTLGALTVILLLSSVTRRLARRFGARQGYGPGRIFQVTVMVNVVAILTTLVVLGVIWGFTGQGFMVIASSLFAVVGIALFAAWSILSNITAAFILFFSAPFQVGDRIRVLDGDNTLTGRVRHMGLIYLTLDDEDGHRYTLPNNMLLQRTVIRLAPNKELPCDKKHCR
ncbi:hypothetical protein A167_01172 [Alcanivorax sp. S71-1-4]|nr:hypothetical protein A167_01172 [Alcanivorax sp. S71-1-4]